MPESDLNNLTGSGVPGDTDSKEPVKEETAPFQEPVPFGLHVEDSLKFGEGAVGKANTQKEDPQKTNKMSVFPLSRNSADASPGACPVCGNRERNSIGDLTCDHPAEWKEKAGATNFITDSPRHG